MRAFQVALHLRIGRWKYDAVAGINLRQNCAAEWTKTNDLLRSQRGECHRRSKEGTKQKPPDSIERKRFLIVRWVRARTGNVAQIICIWISPRNTLGNRRNQRHRRIWRKWTWEERVSPRQAETCRAQWQEYNWSLHKYVRSNASTRRTKGRQSPFCVCLCVRVQRNNWVIKETISICQSVCVWLREQTSRRLRCLEWVLRGRLFCSDHKPLDRYIYLWITGLPLHIGQASIQIRLKPDISPLLAVTFHSSK